MTAHGMDWQRFMALQALGNFGAGMSQAGQPSRFPTSFMGALGQGAARSNQGMSQMLPMMMQMKARESAAKITAAREARVQGKYDREEAQRTAYGQMLGRMPQMQGARPSPGMVGPMPGMDSPQTAMLRSMGPDAGSAALFRQMFPKPDNALVQVFDPKSPTGTTYVPRNKAAGRFGRMPSGMEITVPGPDGSTIIRTGVRRGTPGGMEKGTKKNIETKLFEAREAQARLHQVSQTFDDDFLRWGPQIMAKVSAIREKAQGLPLVDSIIGKVSPTEQKQLRKYATFQLDVLDNLNRYIKEITGAQMSDGEAKRLMKGMPNMNDSPTVFKAKMDRIIEKTRLARVRYTYALRNGILPQKVGAIDDMPRIIDRRALQIEAGFKRRSPNITSEILRRRTMEQLRREFQI